MKKTLAIALLALLAVTGVLWATDATWRYPVPTLAGLNTGDVIVAADPNNLTNTSRIRLLAATAMTCGYGECGTGYSVIGNDSAGIITMGSLPRNATTVLTFNAAWAAPPACVAIRHTGTTADVVQKVYTGTGTMQIIVSTVSATNDRIAYHCLGVS